MQTETTFGRAAPLGATFNERGVNFSLFSRGATGVDLVLFENEEDILPAEILKLDPYDNRTYHYWHIEVLGLKPGRLYGYRVHGPYDPAAGKRFDSSKTLLDPYGRGVTVPKGYDRTAAGVRGAETSPPLKSVLVDPHSYDWEGDRPLERPYARTILYEMHVRGFTQHPNSGIAPENRGTYAGLIEKIPYLQQLGITAVELLPVFQFDAQDAPPNRVNYWGYSPLAFFAPHAAYSSRTDRLGPVDEFRDLVKALHRAGIEVILDVVFNHTAEGNQFGPTLSFRGLDNDIYYTLDPNPEHYANFSGTGNTLNANHPVVRRMILDSLRYWVEHMHVDGFRFDLASILSRGHQGELLSNPPVLWDIESDPVLAGTKFIAEAWDAGGLYQVGSFVGDSWKEWNGQFRDDCRSFFRGDSGALSRFADRLVGSPEIFGKSEREPEKSVNFVTCHDGFTLNDLFTYEHKHNEDNGEENRDGCNDNRSWNCGTEGPTNDPEVESLRIRQIKNCLTVTLFSMGLPMLLMGDEVRRTQRGNNNAYCQDNELSWFDWKLVEQHADLLRFVQLLNRRRNQRDDTHERTRRSLNSLLQGAVINWHGIHLNEPDWSANSHSIALTAEVQRENLRFHYMLNAHREPLEFELPPLATESGGWRRWIDTSLDSPHEIVDWTQPVPIPHGRYHVESHSVAVLIARLPAATPGS